MLKRKNFLRECSRKVKNNFSMHTKSPKVWMDPLVSTGTYFCAENPGAEYLYFPTGSQKL